MILANTGIEVDTCPECGVYVRWDGIYGNWCMKCMPRGTRFKVTVKARKTRLLKVDDDYLTKFTIGKGKANGSGRSKAD